MIIPASRLQLKTSPMLSTGSFGSPLVLDFSETTSSVSSPAASLVTSTPMSSATSAGSTTFVMDFMPVTPEQPSRPGSSCSYFVPKMQPIPETESKCFADWDCSPASPGSSIDLDDPLPQTPPRVYITPVSNTRYHISSEPQIALKVQKNTNFQKEDEVHYPMSPLSYKYSQKVSPREPPIFKLLPPFEASKLSLSSAIQQIDSLHLTNSKTCHITKPSSRKAPKSKLKFINNQKNNVSLLLSHTVNGK